LFFFVEEGSFAGIVFVVAVIVIVIVLDRCRSESSLFLRQ
jgi:hypothetical protein